jgi:prophage antirepressor-like protein
MELIAQMFNGTTIRTIHKEDGFWFVASDIAKALDYRDAANMIRVLDEDEVIGTHTVSTSSADQLMTIINESGVYHAVFNSRKAEAAVFRKWVTSDLLPTLRRKGEYTKTQMEGALSSMQQRIALMQVDRQAMQLENTRLANELGVAVDVITYQQMKDYARLGVDVEPFLRRLQPKQEAEVRRLLESKRSDDKCQARVIKELQAKLDAQADELYELKKRTRK